MTYRPHLLVKEKATGSLPHSENQPQQSVNDFWHYIKVHLSGHWLQTFMNEVLATIIGK